MKIKASDLVELIVGNNPEAIKEFKKSTIDEFHKQLDFFNKYKEELLIDISNYTISFFALFIVIVGFLIQNIYRILTTPYIMTYTIIFGILLILAIFAVSLYTILKYKKNILIFCEDDINHIRQLKLNNPDDMTFIKAYVDFDSRWQGYYFGALAVPISHMLFEIWIRFHWVKALWGYIRKKPLV